MPQRKRLITKEEAMRIAVKRRWDADEEIRKINEQMANLRRRRGLAKVRRQAALSEITRLAIEGIP